MYVGVSIHYYLYMCYCNSEFRKFKLFYFVIYLAVHDNMCTRPETGVEGGSSRKMLKILPNGCRVLLSKLTFQGLKWLTHMDELRFYFIILLASERCCAGVNNYFFENLMRHKSIKISQYQPKICFQSCSHPNWGSTCWFGQECELNFSLVIILIVEMNKKQLFESISIIVIKGVKEFYFIKYSQIACHCDLLYKPGWKRFFRALVILDPLATNFYLK